MTSGKSWTTLPGESTTVITVLLAAGTPHRSGRSTTTSLRRPGAAVVVTLAALTLAALTLAACGSPETPAAADDSITVVTSTNVYGSIAEAVGGNRVAVESLITDPAADPHSYESTPADAATVAGAAIVVFNGGGYDDWMPQLVESAGGQRTVIDVTELPGLPTTEGFNEHFWYSLPTVQKLATKLAADLAAADPAGAAEYTANATAFTDEIAEIVARTEAIGTAHPGTRVAITEPVPGYLIDAAGLTDATPEAFSEAIEEDTDPPAAVLQETLALFDADPVRALILNAQTETPTTDQRPRRPRSRRAPARPRDPGGRPAPPGWMRRSPRSPAPLTPTRRSGGSPAASSSGSAWRRHWSAIPTCCSATSRCSPSTWPTSARSPA